MPLLHLAVLAVVQGLTEFLPVSSSGHLILVPFFTGWPDQGLIMDVAVHIGSLLAVLLYFHRDVFRLALGGLNLLRGRVDAGGRLLLLAALAALPAAIAGLLLHELAESNLRSPAVIAVMLILFGVLLWAADRWAPAHRRLEDMSWQHALFIGLAQMWALIPGVSRSGITMTAARLGGLERSEAARFSFLLLIPIMLGAAVLTARDIATSPDPGLARDALIAAGLSFLSSLAAIAIMMRWVGRAGFAPFAVYRVVLGLAVLLYLLT